MMFRALRVTVFGLGEAGSLIAAHLAETGIDVHGYDPAPVQTPAGITRHETPGSSVAGSLMVLAVTAAVDAEGAMTQALEKLEDGTVYADLSTAHPGLKEDLASTALSGGLAFVDVALMGTVPGNGLATPSFASGPGAARYAAIVNEAGGNVQVLGDNPGDAAARKLLRSVFTKGLTALLIEAIEAAGVRGDAGWLRQHLVELMTDADETLLDRFISGTPKHIDRRIAEMESARDLLASLAVPAPMTTATVDSLQRIRSEGMPSDLDSHI
jgi:3-hydroxyisobutyrate dehydrogenase-like beta-hydroxyacid dehydrogenase